MQEHGMKSATIRRLLRNRLNKWLDTIADQPTKELLKNNTIVSGGCITSMLIGDKVNDYDLYFRTKEAALAAARYYVKIFNETVHLKSKVGANRTPEVREIKITNIKGVTEGRIVVWMQSAGVAAADEEKAYEYFESSEEGAAEDFVAGMDGDPEDAMDLAESLTTPDPDTGVVFKQKSQFNPVFFTDNAISLTGKMQLVIRFYGEPDKIHENYDFAHAMCYYDLRDNKLHLPAEAMECMLSKTLIYKGSLYPIASLFRIRKFVQRGWRITAGQMLKIIFQLQGVDLKNRSILREQLIGVDQAFMTQLLRELEKDDKNVQQIDGMYLAQLIDRIFE